MHSQRVIGYHGCDRETAEKILAGKDQLNHSQNKYDWLGSGRYFWEDDYDRAMRFARRMAGRPAKPINNPFVLGAIIDPGHCLNLLEYGNLQLLPPAFEALHVWLEELGKAIPQNRARSFDGEEDLVLRDLDCAVIEMVHTLRMKSGEPAYDTVRSVFWEGPEVYASAGFRVYNHIQICVRNPACILGYFRPMRAECGWLPGA